MGTENNGKDFQVHVVLNLVLRRGEQEENFANTTFVINCVIVISAPLGTSSRYELVMSKFLCITVMTLWVRTKLDQV